MQNKKPHTSAQVLNTCTSMFYHYYQQHKAHNTPSSVIGQRRRQITVEGFCNQCTKRATGISQFTPHPSFFFLKPFKKDGSKVVVYLHGYNPRSPNVTSRVRDDGGYGNHSSKSKRQTERVWPVRQSVLKLTAHYSQN